METKKMSADLSKETITKLEQMKSVLGMSKGRAIDCMFSTFGNSNSEAGQEVLQFLIERRKVLSLELSSGGKFREEDTKQKLQDYSDMICLMTQKPLESPEDSQTPMQKLKIKDGTLQIPADWLVLNPDEAMDCKYAAVVECRHLTEFGIPHCVFFSPKQYTSEYTDEDIERVKQLCVAAWPKFEEILERQVEPVYDPVYPGKIQNEEEYFSSPIFEIFTIFAKDDPLLPTNYEHPYDAMITRTH